MKREEEEQQVINGPQWVRGKLLGHGGFGTVHVAHFPKEQRLAGRFKDFPAVAAVKTSLNESAEKDLRRERDFLKRLAGCPYIVKYLGEEEAEEGLNVFLEYASGGTLAAAVKKRLAECGHGLPEEQVRVFTRHILGGLRRIHDEGLVHGDLKLDNVLLFSGGDGDGMVAKVADFGVAREVESVVNGTAYGTAIYWAPETASEGIQSQASDIWALGCIVFAMLTGDHPWDRVLSEELLGLISAEPPPRVPDWLCTEAAMNFVDICVTEEPEDRPTAAQLLRHPFVVGQYRSPPRNTNNSSYSDSDSDSDSDSKDASYLLDFRV